MGFSNIKMIVYQIMIRSFLSLECRITLHNILQVLVHKTIQPRQIVLVVNHLSLPILVSRKLHEVLRLLLAKLNTRCLQMPLHLLDLDVALPLGVQQSKSSQYSLGIVRLELLFFEN